MTLPRVKSGSGLDDSGIRKNMALTISDEFTKVNNPTVTKIFSVDRTDGASGVTG